MNFQASDDVSRPRAPATLVRLAGAVALVVALAAPAAADDFWRFDWADIAADPDDPSKRTAAAYERAMQDGDKSARQAALLSSPRINPVRRRGATSYLTQARNAVAAYERASELRPDAAEPHFRAAEVLNAYFLSTRSGAPVIRDRKTANRALAHWDEFIRLAPLDPRTNSVLFRIALVHTKLAGTADLERAVVAYEKLLRRADLASVGRDTASTWLANLAETHMMLGDLDAAITAYYRALSYANEALYAYGLAVALDRDEQGRKAREIMRAYGERDRMRSLDRPTIFFVPDGEEYFYKALGFEALGDLDSAIANYELFIVSGAHPRYQPRARANLREVERLRRKRRVVRPRVDIDLNPGFGL